MTRVSQSRPSARVCTSLKCKLVEGPNGFYRAGALQLRWCSRSYASRALSSASPWMLILTRWRGCFEETVDGLEIEKNAASATVGCRWWRMEQYATDWYKALDTFVLKIAHGFK